VAASVVLELGRLGRAQARVRARCCGRPAATVTTIVVETTSGSGGDGGMSTAASAEAAVAAAAAVAVVAVAAVAVLRRGVGWGLGEVAGGTCSIAMLTKRNARDILKPY